MAQQMQDVEKKKWTYQEYFQLGEEVHCEVIEGELSMTPAPTLDHQDVSINLEMAMLQYVIGKDLGKIFDAPVDVILDENNIVQPDIVFVAKPNLKMLRKKGIVGSPDLVVEIISPSSIQRDRYEKKELYEKFTIAEYWLVDIPNRSIEIMSLDNTKYSLFSFACGKGKVKSKVLAGLEIEISDIIVSHYEE
jgi:Uma2 family endonuclease